MSDLRDDLHELLGHAAVDGGPTMDLVVALDPGKKTGRIEVGVSLVDGSVSAVTDEVADEPAVVVSMKPGFIDQLVAGELDVALAYMRGDAKLEGEPGPVLDALRWFERVPATS
ncbi:MAG: hypothetical protein AAFZ07_24770 [Actinomycetota bacterium]